MLNQKNQIKDFLNKKSDKQKLIVIYGPTWAGKTDMSIDIAKQLNTEIISTDSRQIFKYMNIWTGKITNEEKSWVVHHMLDIIEPNMEYSVWEYKKVSELIINNLFNNNKVPILCWWTGLYINSLIYDFNIPGIAWDEKLRSSLEKEAEEKWKEFIFEKLKTLDPDYDRELHPNNLRYVIRALEVKMLTWKSKTSFKEEKKLKYEVLFLTPYSWDRESLYERINKRVKTMIDQGLVDEVRGLLARWYKESDFWMNSIWYNEIYPYLHWKISLTDAIEKIMQNSRNYAKRQLTWFRKYK